MSINTQNAISQAQSSLRNKATTQTATDGELEKQDFMNLFLTQMSNQDPADPMDSGAMMTQLAQLGTLEQLEELNGQVKDLNTTQKDMARYQSLHFLEKDVLLKADHVELNKGTGKALYYTLDNEADNLKVTIESMDGDPVFSEELGLVAAGKHQYVWDGKNNEGTMMPDGKYKIRFLAFDQAGNSSTLDLYNSGRVAQVEYRDGLPWIRTKHEIMPLSEVKSINKRSDRIFGSVNPFSIVKDLPTKGMIIDEQDNKLIKK